MKDSFHKGFIPLSIAEEDRLSGIERTTYYHQLRAYIKNRRLKTTSPGARFLGPKLKKISNKLAIAVTKAFTNKNIEWIVEGKENIPDGSVIFAFTHQGVLDTFVWIPTIDKHCCVLHGAEVRKLLLLCQMNTGLVLVRKGNRQNNFDAKLDTVRLLLEGHSIVWFPEGTWNLSPNKLHLPMSWGFLDAAKKAGCPVVPSVIEYTYNTSEPKENITRIHICYGKPLYVQENDSLPDKLEEYKEAISTIRYQLMEQKGIEKRKTISNRDYINYMKGNLKNLKFGGVNIDRERSFIFGVNDEYYRYHHINDIPFSESGELLEK